MVPIGELTAATTAPPWTLHRVYATGPSRRVGASCRSNCRDGPALPPAPQINMLFVCGSSRSAKGSATSDVFLPQSVSNGGALLLVLNGYWPAFQCLQFQIPDLHLPLVVPGTLSASPFRISHSPPQPHDAIEQRNKKKWKTGK